MHVLSKKKLQEFWAVHKDTESGLIAWFKVARTARWEKFADVRATYSHADLIEGKFVVFNICGNKCRLITKIYYKNQKVHVKHVLTHPEYDRGAWKNE